MSFVIQSEIVITSPAIPIRIPNYAFVDGQNVETSLLYKQAKLDWLQLYQQLKNHKIHPCSKIICYFKYSFSPQRQKFFEDLKAIGYQVVLSNYCGNGKVNVDADIIVDCLSQYFETSQFNLVLLSGDGDFVPLLKKFELLGSKVWIIGGAESNISENLKTKSRFRDKLTGKINKKLRSFGAIFENYPHLYTILSDDEFKNIVGDIEFQIIQSKLPKKIPSIDG